MKLCGGEFWMSSSGNQRDIVGELESPLGLFVPDESAAAEVLILDTGALEIPVAGETVLLELADLLPDASGEVVLFADDTLPLNIVTDLPVTDAGIADAHVTAAGVDVTGLHFYSFESGLTVYSPTDVLIVADTGAT
jgi:hypothetical protein